MYRLTWLTVALVGCTLATDFDRAWPGEDTPGEDRPGEDTPGEDTPGEDASDATLDPDAGPAPGPPDAEAPSDAELPPIDIESACRAECQVLIHCAAQSGECDGLAQADASTISYLVGSCAADCVLSGRIPQTDLTPDRAECAALGSTVVDQVPEVETLCGNGLDICATLCRSVPQMFSGCGFDTTALRCQRDCREVPPVGWECIGFEIALTQAAELEPDYCGMLLACF